MKGGEKMRKNFLISLKVKDEIFFSTEKSAKGVIEWEEIYEKNPVLL